MRIDVEVAATLPAILVDRTLIARAFTNVIENAFQAMGRAGRLGVRAEASDNFVVFTIADSGVGMSADALAHAFEPYFSTKTAGSGLGLANAKRNVELCGGTMSLASVVGQGTTVTISVPRADSPGVPASA